MKTKLQAGFTVPELLIVGALIAIIGLFAATLVHRFKKEYKAAQKRVCIANLKRIADAKTIFANWKDLMTGAPYTVLPEDIYGYGKQISDKPSCPAGGVYTIGAIGVNPTCSIPGHAIPGQAIAKPVTKPPEPLRIGNCSFLDFSNGGIVNDVGSIESILNKIKRFEADHPDLRITGQQVLISRESRIMGVLIRHETKTNAIVLEQPVPDHAIQKKAPYRGPLPIRSN